LKFANGYVYEGELENDVFNGHGILKVPKGGVYKGVLKNSKFVLEKNSEYSNQQKILQPGSSKSKNPQKKNYFRVGL
jgi:hypothetical protein